MTTVFVHLEPLEDEVSFRDQGLDRPSPGGASGEVGAEDRDYCRIWTSENAFSTHLGE
jgi:hypothetical protein